MRDSKKWRIAATLPLAATVAALMLLAPKAAGAQEKASAGKTFCVGCSPDGKTTPRAADGHPDLSGNWGGGNAPPPGQTTTTQPGGGFQKVFQRAADGSILFDFSTQYNSDGEGTGKICPPLDMSCQVPNQPPYNDKYMKQVTAIAKDEFGGGTPLDPYQDCRAVGVPRAGVPNYIMQNSDVIVFFYNAAPYSTFRIVYLGGRPHPDTKTYETTYFGDSIGHWEGDTLVVDTVGFNDDTWLGNPGATGTAQFTSIHSEKEHAVERLSRDGDVLTYNVTVEDPDAFTKPWVLAPRRIRHSGPGMEIPSEDAPVELICEPTEHFIKASQDPENVKLKCGFRCDK